MRLRTMLALIIAFVAGVGISHVTAETQQAFAAPVANGDFELPSQVYSTITGAAIPRPAPSNHITEQEIYVTRDKVTIDVKNSFWARFTPTNSMSPTFDHNANAIEVMPKSPDQVNEGDIVAYQHPKISGTIIHRVIKKGEDDAGIYFIMQGDNNPNSPDPYKVRFEHIVGVVVALIF